MSTFHSRTASPHPFGFRISDFLLVLFSALLLSQCAPSATAHPDEPAIREFLNRYFSTWSAQDMDGYGACFGEQARITYVEKGGASRSQGLTDFLHGQKLGHAQSPVKMIEVPLDMKISGDTRVAQAAVKWQLTKGAEIVTGMDYFTLVKTPQGWKIAALVFFND
jgi:hypothetical protein